MFKYYYFSFKKYILNNNKILNEIIIIKMKNNL